MHVLYIGWPRAWGLCGVRDRYKTIYLAYGHTAIDLKTKHIYSIFSYHYQQQNIVLHLTTKLSLFNVGVIFWGLKRTHVELFVSSSE